MITIAIAEDDPEYQAVLRRYLQRFEQETGESLRTVFFEDGAALAFDYHPIYDILLLDISMPKMNGMEAARMIRKTDQEVIIIFITSLARYALKGYEVDALDFVVKPIAYYPFSVKLQKAVDLYKSRAGGFLLVTTEEGIERVPTAEILYIEVENHLIRIHTCGHEYVRRGSLSELETQLAPYSFFRCHKCYLVNLRHIRRFTADSVEMTNGDVVLVGRPKKKAFLQAVTDYYGGIL